MAGIPREVHWQHFSLLSEDKRKAAKSPQVATGASHIGGFEERPMCLKTGVGVCEEEEEQSVSIQINYSVLRDICKGFSIRE